MKIIAAVSALGLILSGCGQSNNPSSNPPPARAPATPTAQNGDTQFPIEPPPASAEATKDLNSNNSETEAPNNVNALEQQIGVQQSMIYQEKAAFDEAVKARNNEVHLGPKFMDTAAYGISTGALTWDFLRRSNYINRDTAEIPKSLVPSTEATTTAAAGSAVESGEIATGAVSTASSVFREAAPVALKATEAVSAAVLGVFFIGKTVTFGKDVIVRFSDTNSIKLHRAKLNEAERNLEIAKANLAAIYFPDKTQSF